MLRSLICLILMVHSAAEARDYAVSITTIRNVGDPVSVPIVVMRQPTTVRTLTAVLGYDAGLVAPVLPGGAIAVGGGSITVTSTLAGEVSLSYTGILPAANLSLYSVAFKCLKPGRCQFPIKSVTAKDANGAVIIVTGDTLDWLVITDSGAIRSAVE